MATVNAYLSFNGNCEEAFNFYKSVFGGEFPHIARYGEMPSDNPECSVPESEQNKIMHISLPISSETVLMGADASEAFGPAPTIGNNIALSIATSTQEEADKIFNGLAEGGTIAMPMAKTFWNSYFGMLIDKFGINWMVSYEYK